MAVRRRVKMSELLEYPHDPDQPIAIFDSGVGGLTVVAAVRRMLPNEQILYLGDTARVPYGIKSAVTVTRFATQLAGWLLQHRPKLMVVACNTLSAVAMPTPAEGPSLGVAPAGTCRWMKFFLKNSIPSVLSFKNDLT